MFDLFDDALDVAGGVIGGGMAVVSLGAFGNVDKNSLAALVGTGITLYEISDTTGVALDVLEALLDD